MLFCDCSNFTTAISDAIKLLMLKPIFYTVTIWIWLECVQISGCCFLLTFKLFNGKTEKKNQKRAV